MRATRFRVCRKLRVRVRGKEEPARSGGVFVVGAGPGRQGSGPRPAFWTFLEFVLLPTNQVVSALRAGPLILHTQIFPPNEVKTV